MALSGAGAALRADRVPAGVHTRDDLRDQEVLGCDVAVIGSGAGGAVVAAELAEAGFDVIVLEEGRYFSTRDFTAEASAMIRQLYRGGGATLAMGEPAVMYQEGSTVGGSTVVNGGMAWRTPEHILERWHREHHLADVRAADMELYFDRVERRLHVRRQDPDTVGRDNALLKLGADRKGWRVVDNLRNQVHCAGSNNCAFGCPTGAKQSALVSYIPRALHFGARIYSDLRAQRILHSGKRATGVAARVVLAGGRLGARVTVRARLVVAACGAIHTPALLARSGFRSPSGQLGHNLSLHPNCKVVAIFNEDVRGWEGVHQAYQVREFQDQGFLFAAVNIPPGILAMSLPCYGDELGALMAQYRQMVVAGMLVEDSVVGQVRTLPGGQPLPFYQLSDVDADKLVRGTALLCELLFEAGARRILLPFGGVGELTSPDDIRRLTERRIPKSRMEVVTVHVMGTARMGGDRARAVTDPHGMVYDADRLMVADASLFPTPIGVNPAETISALATRNAHFVIENRRRFLT